MPRPSIATHDATTGETVQREMDDTEYAQYEADQAASKEAAKVEKAEATAKADARQTLLDKLGITEDEAALLLSP